jgi:hypothetical protein
LYFVDLSVFRKNDTGGMSQGNKYLSVPSDYMSTFSLSVLDGTEKKFLLNKDVEYLQEYNPTGATGVPKYYAIFDVNTFILAPVPADSYPVELHYYYRPPSIVDTGTSWIGDNAEQALLYGTLFEAYSYMKGESDLLGLYNQRFGEAMTRLKNYGEGREDTDAYRDGLIRIKAS